MRNVRLMKGQEVTQKLRAFNDWFEDFMVEAARPLIVLGFVLGTVNVFTGGVDVVRDSTFTLAWAIIQAAALDGLFFAVLSQLKYACGWKRKVSLCLVVFSLALVAFLVNDTLSFQQLNGVSMKTAMETLGIQPALFTHIRAGLVVAVSIASALVLERKPLVTTFHPTVEPDGNIVVTEKVTVVTQETDRKLLSQPSEGTVDTQNTEELTKKETSLHQLWTKYTSQPDQETLDQLVELTTVSQETEESPDRKLLVLRKHEEFPEWTQQQIADATGVSKSYVSKILKVVR